MAIDSGTLYYLIDSSSQIESINGKPLVGGYIQVYYAGTSNLATTYSNFDYTLNPPKIPLKSDGRCVILVDISNTYDYYVYDSFGNLVYSRYNIIPLAGSVSIKGLTRVYHDGSLSGLGTEAVPLGIKGGGGGLSTVSTSWPIVGDGSSGNPVTINDIIGLAVNETMTAYSAEGTTGPLEVLGVNTDNLCVTSGFEISEGKIIGYKGTAFSAGSDYLPGNNIQINNNVISVTGLNAYATTGDLVNKLDTTAFSTVSGDFLTQHQSLVNLMPYSGLEYSAGKIVGYKGSAFAGNEFTGVNTDSTLSGNGYNTQLGLADPIIPIVAGSGINITDQGNSIKIDCTVTAEAGHEYSAGSNIDITDDTISVTGLNAYATTGEVANKLNTTAFSTVSGNFLTAHQSLSGYATEDWVTNQGYLTNQQSLVTLMPYSGLEYNDGKIIAYKGSAFAGNTFTGVITDSSLSGNGYDTDLGLAEPIIPLIAGSGINITDQGNGIKIDCTVSGGSVEHEYSAGSNIDITDDVISVTGLNEYAMTGEVAKKLYTTAFSTVSGNFLTQSSLDGLMSVSKLDFTDDNKISGYDGSAFICSGIDSSNVFVANYGTTTYNEISEALSAGKSVFAVNPTDAGQKGMVFAISNTNNNEHTFKGINGNGYSYNTVYTIKCNNNDLWLWNGSYGLIDESWVNNKHYASESAFNIVDGKITGYNGSGFSAQGGGGGSSITGAQLPLKIDNDVITNNNIYCIVSGNHAWSEGNATSALADDSHAEGYLTKTISGDFAFGSHAEGYSTTAYGMGAHAEGGVNIASANGSHAEGANTSALDFAAHAEGQGTITTVTAGHAQGRYNSNTTAAMIIGNGTDDYNRSDAFVVDWEGNVSASAFYDANGRIGGGGSSFTPIIEDI